MLSQRMSKEMSSLSNIHFFSFIPYTPNTKPEKQVGKQVSPVKHNHPNNAKHVLPFRLSRPRDYEAREQIWIERTDDHHPTWKIELLT